MSGLFISLGHSLILILAPSFSSTFHSKDLFLNCWRVGLIEQGATGLLDQVDHLHQHQHHSLNHFPSYIPCTEWKLRWSSPSPSPSPGLAGREACELLPEVSQGKLLHPCSLYLCSRLRSCSRKRHLFMPAPANTGRSWIVRFLFKLQYLEHL